MVNGKQSVKLKSGTIKFKDYFKQLPVPFKIYVDFECILKKVECDITKCDSNSSYTRKYQLFVLTINLVRKLFCTEERMLFTNLINQFLVNTIIAEECKKTFQ